MHAQRDMTRAEFKAALQRRGWRQVLMWIEIGPSGSIGMVMTRKGKRGWQVNRRASLAKAIREAVPVSRS
jgi:hypothetical protein